MRLPKLRTLYFSWLLFLSLPAYAQNESFSPPQDGDDWVQLVSGEWLKGELIGLFNDYLEFDSEILDDLTIELDDVAQIISPRTLSVRIQGAGLLEGEILVNESDVIVTTDGNETTFRRGQLVSLTISAERERDRWSGDLSLGTNIRQGNTEFVEYNAIVGVERRTAASRAFVDYIGSFNETEGQRVANNHRVNIVLDRFSESRFFWRPFSGQYFRDPFQNIRNQATVETGAGYELIDTGITEWDITAGVGVNWVERVSVEADQESSTTSPSSTLGTNFETELTDWIDFILAFQMTFVDEDAGDYQHHLVTTLSTDFVGDLDFDVSFIWDRVQRPPPNADGEVPERDDIQDAGWNHLGILTKPRFDLLPGAVHQLN